MYRDGILFPQGINNEETYLEANRFIREFCSEIISRFGTASDWSTPWFAQRYGNGALFLDGDVVSFLNSSLNRGFVIGIGEKDQKSHDWTAWIDQFDDKIDFLSIGCNGVDGSNLALITWLLSCWLNEFTDTTRMQSIIDAELKLQQ